MSEGDTFQSDCVRLAEIGRRVVDFGTLSHDERYVT